MWAEPVEMVGQSGSLVPLDRAHADELAEAAADGELHRLWYTTVPAPEAVADEIERRLGLWAEERMAPFAILDADGRAVGMTTYMNIDKANRRVEIGSTWYRAAVQRTPLNTECKRMLLGHAFERLGCHGVEFRTHRLNTQSRRAIERLGAQLDGILRQHTVLANGTVRDTAVYSIIAAEWPTVRAHLDWQLEKPRG